MFSKWQKKDWRADSVLFLAVSCQNTRPIKKVHTAWRHSSACVWERMRLLYLCDGTCVFQPRCWITVNDKTTNRVVFPFCVSAVRLYPSCLCLYALSCCLSFFCTLMRACEQLHLWVCICVYTCAYACVFMCIKCISRACCQLSSAVVVAVAGAVSLSSLPVTRN